MSALDTLLSRVSQPQIRFDMPTSPYYVFIPHIRYCADASALQFPKTILHLLLSLAEPSLDIH